MGAPGGTGADRRFGGGGGGATTMKGGFFGSRARGRIRTEGGLLIRRHR